MTQATSQVSRHPKPIPERFVPRGDPLKMLVSARKKYDEIVRLKFGVSDYYLVIDPKLVEEALVTKQAQFGKLKYVSAFVEGMKAFQQGLIQGTSVFEDHDMQKRRLLPAFHTEKINGYAKMMTDITQKYAANWKNGQVFDLSKEMVKLTTLLVANCLFSVDVESRINEIGPDLTTVAAYYERLSNPLASILVRLPSNKKYDLALKRLDTVLAKVIKDRQASKEERNDLLSILLQAKNEKGSNMTYGQIRDQVGIFLVVGHETSANCLTWTYYLLSQNPSVEEKFLQEIDSVFSDDHVPTYADVPKLNYTLKVVTESLRMYPPSWGLVRQAMKGTNLGDYFIPKDSHIWVSQFLNHRDARFFPEPEKFNPERWTEDFKKSIPKFAYFPFGGGARRCIGEPFAWMEIELILAWISRRWKLSHVPGQKVAPHAGITLVPKNGMKMKLEKR